MHRALLHRKNTGSHAADEVAVVRDEEQRALILLKHALHPLARGDVEMVGGFVEQKEVDGLKGEQAVLEAGTLAARQICHPLEDLLAQKVIGGQAVARHLGGQAPALPQQGVEQRALGVLEDEVLGHEPHLDVDAPLHASLHGRQLAAQQLEQGGLSGAVVAQQRHALALFELKAHMLEQLFAVVAHRHVLEREHVKAAAAAVVERGADAAVVLPHPLGLVFPQPGNALSHAQRRARQPLGLDAPAQQPGRHGLQALDFLLLALIVALLQLGKLLLVVHIFAVVSGVVGNLAVFQLHDAVHGAVEKGAVVRNEQHGALIVKQKLLRPLDGGHVQVVGGLVEQQDVGVCQHDAGQVDLGLFPARQRLKGACEKLLFQVQPRRHAGKGEILLVAALALIARMQPVVALQQRRGGIAFHLLAQGGKLRLHVVQGGKAGAHDLLHRGARRVIWDLLKHLHAKPRRDGQRPAVRLHLSAQQAKQGGLAAPVSSDEAHMLSLPQLKAHVRQHHMLPKGFLQLCRCNPNHVFSSFLYCFFSPVRAAPAKGGGASSRSAISSKKEHSSFSMQATPSGCSDSRLSTSTGSCSDCRSKNQPSPAWGATLTRRPS